MKIKKNIITPIFLVLFIFLVIYVNLWYHEKMHETIFYSLGCVNTTTVLYPWGGFVNCTSYPEGYDYNLSNVLNIETDNIGYQVSMNLTLIQTFLVLILSTLLQIQESLDSKSNAIREVSSPPQHIPPQAQPSAEAF